MFQRLDIAFRGVRGIEVIGAAEIEIVNVEKMKVMASVADEARKLDVIVSLMPEEEKSLYKTGITSYALVHFHGIVDLGAKDEENRYAIEKSAERYCNHNYALKIKNLYST